MCIQLFISSLYCDDKVLNMEINSNYISKPTRLEPISMPRTAAKKTGQLNDNCKWCLTELSHSNSNRYCRCGIFEHSDCLLIQLNESDLMAYRCG